MIPHVWRGQYSPTMRSAGAGERFPATASCPSRPHPDPRSDPMTVTAARQTAIAALTALALSVAGCGQAAAPGARSATAGHAFAAATTSDIPSESAKMICKPEAEREIAAALGAQTSQP